MGVKTWTVALETASVLSKKRYAEGDVGRGVDREVDVPALISGAATVLAPSSSATRSTLR
jgi:hypothetical protein